MFGDSPFAEPTSSYNQSVLPVQTDPTDEPLVSIPINQSYIPYLVGAVQQLLLQAAYPSSLTPDQLNLVQSRWMDAINAIGTAAPVKPIKFPAIGVDIGDVMIRQNPANPCQLQSSVDGTDWCTFADFSLCIPNSNQPGPGAPQPAPDGGQACYSIQMPANQFSYLPTTVNTGDVLQIQNPTGAVSSSHNDLWRCEDGGQFFAGANVGYPQTFVDDPLPGSPSGALIVVVGGMNYFIGAGSWTVPGGITNAPLLFQVNDADTTGLSGSYQFQVCVTNNAMSSYSHTFPISTLPSPWIVNCPVTSDLTQDFADWVSGTGFVGQCLPQGGGEYLVAVACQLTCPAMNFSDMQVTYDADSTTGGGALEARIYYGGSTSYDSVTASIAHGTGLIFDVPNTNNRTPTYLVVYIPVWEAADASCDGGAALGHITSITISGSGPDPF